MDGEQQRLIQLVHDYYTPEGAAALLLECWTRLSPTQQVAVELEMEDDKERDDQAECLTELAEVFGANGK